MNLVNIFPLPFQQERFSAFLQAVKESKPVMNKNLIETPFIFSGVKSDRKVQIPNNLLLHNVFLIQRQH